jgi:dienelactone hydrolase
MVALMGATIGATAQSFLRTRWEVGGNHEARFEQGERMDLHEGVTEKGVTERPFDLEVEGERVPGILWTPEGATGPRPTILLGHGGTQHKRVPNVLALARRFVRHQGFAAIAIDAPGHGERATEADRAAAAVTVEERRRRLTDMSPDLAAAWVRRTKMGMAEWRSTLDAVSGLDEVGSGPFGYWGVSMGTAIGLPFVSGEPRVRAAVLGLAGLRLPGSEGFERAANRLEVPVLFVLQWRDELVSHEDGLALFDAIGSDEKTMHVNPGGHIEMPLFERDDAAAFFVRHLGRSPDR